ncbi:MAG: triose-phosphate isomerase [Lachnospiraceae bacterium]|nr:triose-phosphate isomerase [Lachnospiraceae bacterium]
MRQTVIAGNWKMNKTPSETRLLLNEFKELLKNSKSKIIICVPTISLKDACEIAKDTNINIGAQNVYFEERGAFTGETSPEMLDDIGVKYVIIGHSERRKFFGDTDDTVNKKVIKAIEHGITPIICCGETLSQREKGVAINWVRKQIKIAYKDVTKEQAVNTIIAYEPIWAIGTGKVATSEQAQEVCHTIRKCLAFLYDEETAGKISILYGGSVTKSSIGEIVSQADIDGGLVGGASLTSEFAEIVNIADN